MSLHRPQFRWWHNERGAGAALALTVLMVVITLIVGVFIGFAALNQIHRMQGVADTAALAAADAARGIIAANPCLLATDIAGAQGVIVESCEQTGEVVTVHFHAEILLLRVQFAARAGPP